MTRTRTTSTAAALLAGACVLLLAACDKKEEAPPPAPPPPPPIQSAPRDPVVFTQQELSVPEKVDFPEDRRPLDAAKGQAVADLAGAIASGDADAMDAALAPSAKAVLSSMRAASAWSDATRDVRSVRVCTVSDLNGELRVGLGVETPGGAYLTGWRGELVAGAWVFTGVPINPASAPTAAALDGAPLDPRPHAEAATPPEAPANPEGRPGGAP